MSLRCGSVMREHVVARTTDDKTPDHIGAVLAPHVPSLSHAAEFLDDLCGHLLTQAPHYPEELAVAARHPSTAAC